MATLLHLAMLQRVNILQDTSNGENLSMLIGFREQKLFDLKKLIRAIFVIVRQHRFKLHFHERSFQRETGTLL